MTRWRLAEAGDCRRLAGQAKITGLGYGLSGLGRAVRPRIPCALAGQHAHRHLQRLSAMTSPAKPEDCLLLSSAKTPQNNLPFPDMYKEIIKGTQKGRLYRVQETPKILQNDI